MPQFEAGGVSIPQYARGSDYKRGSFWRFFRFAFDLLTLRLAVLLHVYFYAKNLLIQRMR